MSESVVHINTERAPAAAAIINARAQAAISRNGFNTDYGQHIYRAILANSLTSAAVGEILNIILVEAIIAIARLAVYRVFNAHRIMKLVFAASERRKDIIDGYGAGYAVRLEQGGVNTAHTEGALLKRGVLKHNLGHANAADNREAQDKFLAGYRLRSGSNIAMQCAPFRIKLFQHILPV